ncbi:MAG: hypothetical protein C0601_09555 [Candidatus Muiribacterium halophilum]|uniref:Uncharacterized protein n=1 Tax=Muiribacterium halophilum TaxID=2053465 RepID=A0A2N5ZDG3_MUIH1|nr:MAG: hypothetical protein C0601_09555 [Candidatus Muirbacterium halophilum]
MYKENPAFNIKDCALVAIATGKKAHNLRELKDIISTIDEGSVYYHFWGMLLKPRFLNREYNNEFAMWVKRSLHDSVLAERLAVIDPTDYDTLEELRTEVIDTIEERLDENEWINFVKPHRRFHFIRSHIVVFDTHTTIESPEQLVDIIPNMSTGSIFYHFIDARGRGHQNEDDFRQWLSGFGEDLKPLCDKIAGLDPYFVSPHTLRDQLDEIFTEFFRGEVK